MCFYYGMMGQALCDSSGLTPPGPEGSNGTRKLLCASQAWPTFLPIAILGNYVLPRPGQEISSCYI